MNNLEVFGCCIVFGIICGGAITVAFAALGLIEKPKSLEQFLTDWVEYILGLK